MMSFAPHLSQQLIQPQPQVPQQPVWLRKQSIDSGYFSEFDPAVHSQGSYMPLCQAQPTQSYVAPVAEETSSEQRTNWQSFDLDFEAFGLMAEGLGVLPTPPGEMGKFDFQRKTQPQSQAHHPQPVFTSPFAEPRMALGRMDTMKLSPSTSTYAGQAGYEHPGMIRREDRHSICVDSSAHFAAQAHRPNALANRQRSNPQTSDELYQQHLQRQLDNLRGVLPEQHLQGPRSAVMGPDGQSHLPSRSTILIGAVNYINFLEMENRQLKNGFKMQYDAQRNS